MQNKSKKMTDEALRRQRHRGVILRDYLRKSGDRDYDPDAALLRSFSDLFPRFTGHMVGQRSLEYALLLLRSDDRTYGTDDAGEANRILRKILEYQDLRSGSDTYGNFFWMTHWDRVKDANAVSFLCSGLVHAYLAFPDKLREETKSALERSFPAMLKGIRGHKVRWQYTNIFFLNLGGLVSLARVLNDPSAHAEAVEDFNTWLENTSGDGFHEFNSPAYTPVTLFGLEAAWANTNDKIFRDRLRRAMDIIAYQLALNLCPNGFLGGALSRAYPDNILRDARMGYAHIKFGTPYPLLADGTQKVMGVNQTIFDYVPPESVRKLALAKAEYAEIHDQCVSINSRRTHVMTPKYSLASQCMDSVGGHSPPPYILMVRHTAESRYIVPFLPDESFLHQPCAAFHCRQAGARIVGRLHYDLAVWRTNLKNADKMDQRDKFMADPTFICEPRLLFGFRDQIRGVRVGNVDWGGDDIQLLPGQSVAVSYGDLYVGVVAMLLESSGRPAAGHARLFYGVDERLRLCLRIFGGPGLRRQDNPLDALVFFEVKVPAAGDSLASYAGELAGWQLSRSGKGKKSSFAARHADGTKLAYPYGAGDSNPIGRALHLSPGLKLQPGDLAKLVNGTKPMPF